MMNAGRPISARRAALGLALSAAIGLAALSQARADEAARALAVAHLEAGTLADGEAELVTIAEADPSNADARLGLGVIRFVGALENLSQGLYTYGLKPPQSFLVPVMRLPVPENPNPKPITYQDFRGLIEAFVKDLALAEETLAGVRGDVKLALDLKKLRYDANGDGTIGDDELISAVVQRIAGMAESDMPVSLTFAFDTADASWLRGYSNVLMAFGEFFLAHDWRESFDASFFHFFPAMKSSFRDALSTTADDPIYSEVAPIADFISFMHIRWPVAEPARMAAVRNHLKAMVAFSRETWDLIEAETDDDREWLPNPRQTSPFVSVIVDAERIAAWRDVLDEADLILDGKKLVPHWRFRQGFDLRRVFEEPRPFDVVLWITGPAALPYLEDGPTTTSADWDRMVNSFGGSFGIFAVWAN
jgi:hypothetical protein